MRRALLAVAVLSPMVAAAYACSTDTFSGADAAPEGGGGVTQADFCDAEALYFHQCGYDDAACAAANLKNCGTVYSTLTNGYTTALTNCIRLGQAPCTGEASKLLTSTCMSGQLAGYVSDSGALASLAKDFCDRCDKGSTTCQGKFASAADQPGYIPSFYSDNVIQAMDKCVQGLDGGTIVVGDASIDCLTQALLCEYTAISNAAPSTPCNDH